MSYESNSYGRIWSDTWLWEILSIILSGSCLVLTTVLLKIYDQKPPPQFIYGITLNALISILATFSKSSLLVAVAGAMSQLKWRWFLDQKGRSMLDTQLFEDASRGPWGSAILLTTPHSWSLVSIGALVSILALAFDPFSQQLLSYPNRGVIVTDPAAQASNISQARAFVANDWGHTASDVVGRTTASLYLPDGAEGFAAAQCPTGNCTWDEFESLALCTTCQDRKKEISLSDPSLFWNASVGDQVLEFPSNYTVDKSCFLQFPENFPCDFLPRIFSIRGKVQSPLGSYTFPSELDYQKHLFETSMPPDQVYFGGNISFRSSIVQGNTKPNLTEWKLRHLPLLTFCHIRLDKESNNGSEKPYIGEATTCNLTPCVKRYDFSISNGTPNIKIVGDRYGSWYFNTTGLVLTNGELRQENDDRAFNETLYLSWDDMVGENGRISTLHNTTRPPMSFMISDKDLFPFREVQNVFQGRLRAKEIFADDKRNRISNNSGIHFKQEFFLSSDSYADPDPMAAAFGGSDPLASTGQNSLAPLSVSLQQIADNGGLSWFMPRLAAELSKYFREEDGIPVIGRSYTTVTIVEVRWPWLSLPVVTLVSAAAFLMLTMWTCRGADQVLWKTSTLPWIYHGFEAHNIEVIKATADRLDSVSGMENFAKTLRARLQKDPVDGQLKLKMMR
ncbi:hypothetical protein F5B22DRAFT_584661 [Xylaria bambusicola]|uniref:uncharacterized protein n=1 Tax=Xylaria bambusicola TaxID=326684 RepID=UPI0020087C1A|nr:uncharacterized protein F5B22DRAFT_584661 [Xylaria bambusicola]KAI0526157.1 hypothetical protein F5B22DRAFT_584661 [Xylaria bambusicola]